LKVSIGAKVMDGPWGGGNLFVINLSNYLLEKGHEVVYDLNENDIDIILLTDPRKSSESSSFTHRDIKKYKKKNPNVKVVHRINECDERKNTRGLNKFYIKANKVADHTIFVSHWLKQIYINSGFTSMNYSVILAGADPNIFNMKNKKTLNKNEKLKIVTHHWSGNWNKGFDIYERLDDLLKQDYWGTKLEFTYIGNLPKKFTFKKANYIEPLSGMELAKELKNNHLYITASLNEPSGNHHIEASQCGLPVMYLNSGGTPEYCKDFGLMYDHDNFEEKLNEALEEIDKYNEKMTNYTLNSNKMCTEFLTVFNNLLLDKE